MAHVAGVDSGQLKESRKHQEQGESWGWNQDSTPPGSLSIRLFSARFFWLRSPPSDRPIPHGGENSYLESPAVYLS